MRCASGVLAHTHFAYLQCWKGSEAFCSAPCWCDRRGCKHFGFIKSHMLSRLCSGVVSKTNRRNGRLGHAATSSCFAKSSVLVLACLCLLGSLTQRNFSVRESTHHVRHRGSSFVIAMATVQRPGDTNYVGNAVMSLYCALNVSHMPSTWPTVLVINNHIPPAQHLAFAALPNISHAMWYLQNGLSLEYRGIVHQQLHDPGFVLDMAARAAMPEHVGCHVMSCGTGCIWLKLNIIS